MAEEPETKETKRKKTAVPEAPARPKEALPTPPDIRAAKKAELVAWATRYELSSEGKVDDLRKRLLAYVAKETREEAPPA